MTRPPHDLVRLGDIAAMKRDVELAKVRDVVQRLNRLSADIALVETARRAREADPVLDIARLSGADVAWRIWGETRLRALQGEHAALRVEHEVALAAARRDFGRAEALTRLIENEKRAARPSP